jgi:hypothetical protein
MPGAVHRVVRYFVTFAFAHEKDLTYFTLKARKILGCPFFLDSPLSLKSAWTPLL